MKRILFIEFWNCTPHLETSFEIAKRHLDDGDGVKYFFCGHDVPYKEGISKHRHENLFQHCLPESRCARLINCENFHFHGRVHLPGSDFDIPKEINSQEDLRKIRYKKAELGLAALSSLMFIKKSSTPDINKDAELIRTMLKSGAMVYDFACQIMQNYNPDLVYIFNGRFCNYRPLLDAAKEIKIPYLIHERGSSKSKYFVQPFMPHDFRRVQDNISKLWQESQITDEVKSVAKKFYTDRRNGIERCWKSFVLKQNPGLLPNLDASKKTIVYFTSSDDEYKAVGDIVKWDRWPDQITALQDIIDICKNRDDLELVVRVHPHVAEKSNEDQAFWKNFLNGSGAMIVGPSEAIDTYALIEHAYVVVTSMSTVGIEAVYWGVPSICLGPSLYSRLGAVYLPNNKNELKAMLTVNDLVANPAKALPYGYYMATYGEEFKHYSAQTLFSGEFMGQNIQHTSGFCLIGRRIKTLIRVLAVKQWQKFKSQIK